MIFQTSTKGYYIIDEFGVVDLIKIEPSSSFIYNDAYIDIWHRYMLPQFLSNYGQPDEALLQIVRDPEHLYPYHLLLYYPQQGVMVRYIDLAERAGDVFHLCLNAPGITLWLWSPAKRVTPLEIAEIDRGLGGPSNDLTFFKPLDDLSEMNIEMFYNIFSNDENQECIEILASNVK